MEPSRIPLLNRRNEVVGYALCDPADADLVRSLRWSLQVHRGGLQYAIHATGTPRLGTFVQTSMHRFLLGMRVGDGRNVDHINGDGLDNRRVNLREVTHAANMQNRRKRVGRSRFRGVWWRADKQRWTAAVRVPGYRYFLGTYTTELEAARAAEAKRREVMPFAEPDPLLVIA